MPFSDTWELYSSILARTSSSDRSVVPPSSSSLVWLCWKAKERKKKTSAMNGFTNYNTWSQPAGGAASTRPEKNKNHFLFLPKFRRKHWELFPLGLLWKCGHLKSFYGYKRDEAAPLPQYGLHHAAVLHGVRKCCEWSTFRITAQEYRQPNRFNEREEERGKKTMKGGGGGVKGARKDERIAAEPALATQFDWVIYSSVGSILPHRCFFLLSSSTVCLHFLRRGWEGGGGGGRKSQ